MNGFRTKLDFSDNRQVKQRIETTTVLSGATAFGVPYDQLPTGPNYTLSSITQTLITTSASTGTFSGNNTTTVYTWPDSRLYAADSTLSALTPSNSAITQTTDYVFNADTTSIFTVDGNVGYGVYSGIGYTIFVTNMVNLGSNHYSGTVQYTNVQLVEAPGVDFSGRTIWADISGITRTDRMIISRDASIGKVFMCNSAEGMGKWETLSGLTATTALWTNTGVGGTAIKSTNGVTHTITGASDYSIIAGGNVNRVYLTEGGFVGGGTGNKLDNSDLSFTIAGDGLEVTNSQHSGIVGGEANYITDSYRSIIAGGSGQEINNNSIWASIFGGRFNSIKKSPYSSVLGGTVGAISGGSTNAILTSNGSAISGSSYSQILGGKQNFINTHNYSTIINGSGNTIHFDIGDFAKTNNLEMIDNSIDSVISASTSSKISSSQSMTITNSISSAIINSMTTGFDTDPDLTSGGIIGVDGLDNGANTIIGTADGLIKYGAVSNTIIGSGIAHIFGGLTAGMANYNLIGNSNSANITDYYNINAPSTYNTILGSQYINLRAPNFFSTVIGSTNITIDYSDSSSVFSSKFSQISTGTTSSIIGGSGHTLSNTRSSINIGGEVNTLNTADYSIIAGGSGNTITKNTDNLTHPKYSGIFAGKNNKIIPRFGSGSDGVSGSYCAIVGGGDNTISGHSYSFIGGGSQNLIACEAGYNAIIGGEGNVNHAAHGVIIGGYYNTLSAMTSCPSYSDNSVIVGGNFNFLNQAENSVILGGQAITATTSNTVYVPNMVIGTGGTQSTLDVYGNARFRSIGSAAQSGTLHYTSDGTLTTNTSDERLKTNIKSLTNSLDKVKQLRGVTYNWNENPNGDVRIGFIAQEVNVVVPELTFVNPNSSEKYMGVHYDNVTALLVEAVKELSTGITTSNNTHLETQTVLAEDNNIELNFNGTPETAIGGGLSVLHAKGENQSANLITDDKGDFITNNDFKPQALTIPIYTPTSSNDTVGSEGNITRDDNYMYIKTSTGWKRTNLESF